MIAHAQGELLAQVRPAVTTAVTLFSTTGIRVEATLLLASFVSGSTGTVDLELYHDDDGTTFDNTNIILARRAWTAAGNVDGVFFQANSVGSGIFVKEGGSLGVRCSVANEVVFSLYGISAQLADRVRGGL